MLICETCRERSFYDVEHRADFVVPDGHQAHHDSTVDVTGVSDEYRTSIFDAHMRIHDIRSRIPEGRLV